MPPTLPISSPLQSSATTLLHQTSALARSLSDLEASLGPLANDASATDEQLRAVLHQTKDVKERIEDMGLYVEEVKEVAYYVGEMLGEGG